MIENLLYCQRLLLYLITMLCQRTMYASKKLQKKEIIVKIRMTFLDCKWRCISSKFIR